MSFGITSPTSVWVLVALAAAILGILLLLMRSLCRVRSQLREQARATKKVLKKLEKIETRMSTGSPSKEKGPPTTSLESAAGIEAISRNVELIRGRIMDVATGVLAVEQTHGADRPPAAVRADRISLIARSGAATRCLVEFGIDDPTVRKRVAGQFNSTLTLTSGDPAKSEGGSCTIAQTKHLFAKPCTFRWAVDESTQEIVFHMMDEIRLSKPWGHVFIFELGNSPAAFVSDFRDRLQKYSKLSWPGQVCDGYPLYLEFYPNGPKG